MEFVPARGARSNIATTRAILLIRHSSRHATGGKLAHDV